MTEDRTCIQTYPTRWEYTEERWPSPMSVYMLDRLGDLGWELVAVFREDEEYHYLFKCPKT